MPWFGCSEFGNSVVKVSSLSGRRLGGTEYIGKKTVICDPTVRCPKHRFHHAHLNLGDVDIAPAANPLAYLVYDSEFVPAMMALLRKLSMPTCIHVSTCTVVTKSRPGQLPRRRKLRSSAVRNR